MDGLTKSPVSWQRANFAPRAKDLLGATRRKACSLNLTLLEKVCGTDDLGVGSKRPHGDDAFAAARLVELSML